MALSVVGIAARMHHYPRQLSGGQEPGVAIARAVCHGSGILVADERPAILDKIQQREGSARTDGSINLASSTKPFSWFSRSSRAGPSAIRA